MIFVTSSDWFKVAKTLDTVMLSAQVVSICCVLDELHEVEGRRDDYPLRLPHLWGGYEPQLAELGLACIEELGVRRGEDHIDGLRGRVMWHLLCATSGEYSMEKPTWTDDDRVHLSHRSALFNLNPDHYLPIWGKFECIPIFWPDVT